MPSPAVAPFDTDQAKAHQKVWADHLAVPVEYENSLGVKFRLIPPGEFMMGCPEDEIEWAISKDAMAESHEPKIRSAGPQHQVALTHPFYMSTTEVTQSVYENVMGKNPSQYSAGNTASENAQKVIGIDTSQFPAESMTWLDAAEFCAKLSEMEQLKPQYFRGGLITLLEGNGYRLPTEAEWEFACRAGTTTMNWAGEEPEALRASDWTGMNSGGRPHNVGQLKSNPFGLFDMLGNVWEWTGDHSEEGYFETLRGQLTVDPKGPSNDDHLRIIKGGQIHDYANARSGARSIYSRGFSREHLGIRLVLPVEAVKSKLQLQAIDARPVPSTIPPNQPPSAVAPFDADQAKAHQQAWADYLGVPVEKEMELPGGETMTFMLIPPGEFMMGTADAEIDRLVELVNHTKQPWTVEMVNSEGPRHPVPLSNPFYIGKYEVSQDQWQAVSRNNPAEHRGSGDLPVENISWDDTQSFLKSLNSTRASEELQFALPTEEQWEFACRAGTDSLWHFGDDVEQLGRYGWFAGNSERTTHSVGQLQPNAFGLHDVHGNVSEWCNNSYTYSYSEDPAATRPDSRRTSLTNYRTHRGGKFQSQAELVRSAVRAGATPNRQDGGTGFRLVMVIDVSKIKERKPSGESVSSISPVEVLTSPEFTWTEPVPFFEAVNSDAFEGSPSLSSDGSTLFFTRLGKNGRPEGNELLMTTRSSTGEWSTPQRPPGDPGELLGLSEPHLHEESASLYLHTSQLPGKLGASDLYVSHRDPGTSSWSSPESLGPTVNSAAQDQAPTLTADGLVLVFHSDRDGGRGNMDLWISTRESSGAEWSPPVSVGGNVNSEQWETHPCLSSDGLALLFVRRELATNSHRSLWQSVRRDRDSDWEPATEIRLSDNGVRRNVRSPALSADGKILIFASGSRGGKDEDLMISRRVPAAKE